MDKVTITLDAETYARVMDLLNTNMAKSRAQDIAKKEGFESYYPSYAGMMCGRMDVVRDMLNIYGKVSA
jgi:hypothetical protein